MGSLDGEDTSRDSDTSPSYSRIAGRYESDETEAANMLGTGYTFLKNLLQHFNTFHSLSVISSSWIDFWNFCFQFHWEVRAPLRHPFHLQRVRAHRPVSFNPLSL